MAKKRTPPGLDPAYARLRDERERRRAEVDGQLGFDPAVPHRAWSKSAKRGAAVKRSQQRRGRTPD